MVSTFLNPDRQAMILAQTAIIVSSNVKTFDRKAVPVLASAWRAGEAARRLDPLIEHRRAFGSFSTNQNTK